MTGGESPQVGKRCFVIGPIGGDASPERMRADKVFRHVLRPAAAACGYVTIERADMLDQPGIIGAQIIDHLLDDDLVIADLTGGNPNVMYELAIRHAVLRPVVQIIQAGERIPFDLREQRTIRLDHTDLDSAHDCRERLKAQIKAVEEDPTLVDSPLSRQVKIRALELSADPKDRRDADVLQKLDELALEVQLLGSSRRGLYGFESVLDYRPPATGPAAMPLPPSGSVRPRGILRYLQTWFPEAAIPEVAEWISMHLLTNNVQADMMAPDDYGKAMEKWVSLALQAVIDPLSTRDEDD